MFEIKRSGLFLQFSVMVMVFWLVIGMDVCFVYRIIKAKSVGEAVVNIIVIVFTLIHLIPLYVLVESMLEPVDEEYLRTR